MALNKGRKRTANEAFRTHLWHRKDTERHGTHGKVVIFEDSREIDADPERLTSGPLKKSNKGISLKERARQLQPTRQKLPIFQYANEIQRTLREQDVLLLVGETGSGKSTQIPQFLVDEPWCKQQRVKSGASQGANVGGCIAITQPRRVAAISLARRVAEEIGTPLGNSSPASQVGYSVRFENSTSPSTRIKFLTEGMLLQEMLRDPWLREYSAVIVDEVHERGVDVDLLLGFLRRMQDLRQMKDGRGGISMKVVVMSATADMEKIKHFFDTKHNTNHEIATEDLTEGGDEWSGFIDEAAAPAKLARQAPSTTSDGHMEAPTGGITTASTSVATSLFIEGRQYPVKLEYSLASISDVLDAAYERVKQIRAHTPLRGDILVFLTGQETVESLLGLLTSWSSTIQKDLKQSQSLPKLLLLPLYAALPSNLQQRVFLPTPKFTRKIILATNIAETSITVPGIKYVIDTGKAKQRLFRPSLNLDTLFTLPISRSSANQRAGRAGRDAPGTAYRLYTEADFYQLAQDTQPEILRCDLSQLTLTLKAHSIDDLVSFPFLTPPPRRALERAMVHLFQLAALDQTTGEITELGQEMSVLPLPTSLARVLLASAEPVYDCVDEIVDIVSALSVENIFLNIHNIRVATSVSNSPPRPTSKASVEENDLDFEDGSSDALALEARRHLFRREGDHLTLLATMQAYAAENTDRRRWCEERRISHRAMSVAMDVRKQLTALMKRYQTRHKSRNKNDADKTTHHRDTHPVPAHDRATLPVRILKCMLTGFHPNVARLCADGAYRTVLTNQPVAIHPSSVLFSVPSRAYNDDEGAGTRNQQKKFEGILYNEFVYTGAKAYARGVSAIELVWLENITL